MVTVVEDRPIMSAEYRIPLLAKTDPPCNVFSLRYLSYLFSNGKHCLLHSLGNCNSAVLKSRTYAPVTGARNQRHKFDEQILGRVSYHLASNFSDASFWIRIETALCLCRKLARTAFSDWLTDLFTFSAFTVWDFYRAAWNADAV